MLGRHVVLTRVISIARLVANQDVAPVSPVAVSARTATPVVEGFAEDLPLCILLSRLDLLLADGGAAGGRRFATLPIFVLAVLAVTLSPGDTRRGRGAAPVPRFIPLALHKFRLVRAPDVGFLLEYSGHRTAHGDLVDPPDEVDDLTAELLLAYGDVGQDADL